MKKKTSTLYAIGRYLLLFFLIYIAIVQILCKVVILFDINTAIFVRMLEFTFIYYKFSFPLVFGTPHILTLYGSYELFVNKRRKYGSALLIASFVYYISYFGILNA